VEVTTLILPYSVYKKWRWDNAKIERDARLKDDEPREKRGSFLEIQYLLKWTTSERREAGQKTDIRTCKLFEEDPTSGVCARPKVFQTGRERKRGKKNLLLPSDRQEAKAGGY